MMNTVAKKKKPVAPMKQPFGSMPLGQKPMPKPPSAPNPAYPVPAAPKPIAQQPQPKPQPPAQPPTPPPTSNVAPFLNRPPPRIPQTDPRNAAVGVPTKPTPGPLPSPKAQPASAPLVDDEAKARAIEMATRRAKDKLREQSIANTGPDTSGTGVDQATADLISQMIAGGGKANTAEEEKLIQDMFQGQLSNQLAGQRARSGRLGFAASGANAAMEGDLRRQGSQQALQDILGLRRGENQRSIDNAFKGVTAEYDTVRGAARDQAIIDALVGEGSGGSDGATSTTSEGGSGQGVFGGVTDANGDGVVDDADKISVGREQQTALQAMTEWRAAHGGDWAISEMPRGSGPAAEDTVFQKAGYNIDGKPAPGFYYSKKDGKVYQYSA